MNPAKHAQKTRIELVREQNAKDLAVRRARQQHTVASAPPRCSPTAIALQFDAGGIGGRWAYKTAHTLADVLSPNYFHTERNRFRPLDTIDVIARINAPTGDWECSDLVVAIAAQDCVLVVPKSETTPVMDTDGRVIGYKLAPDETPEAA